MREAGGHGHDAGMPSDDWTALTSPDGRLQLLHRTDWDDRSGPWVGLRLQALPGPELLASVSSLIALDDIAFVPGGVQFTARPWRGPVQRVEVDAQARCFRLHPGEPWLLLTELRTALEPPPLAPGSPPPAPMPAPPRTGRQRLGDALNVGLGLMFVAAGAWMALAAEKRSDRWIGLFGVLFFGACTALPLWEAWQRRRGNAAQAAPPAR